MHVAARAEVTAGAGDDDSLDQITMVQLVERAAKLVITFESQRIFALRTAERDRCDPILAAPQEMLWRKCCRIESHALVPPSIISAAPLMSLLSGAQSVAIRFPIAS